MDRSVTALASVLALGSLACGEPLVAIGDAPGLLRIVAGVPDSSGSRIGEVARRSLLDTPQGLAVGRDETLYIADTENGRILAVTTSGGIQIVIDVAAGSTGPREPVGVAVNAIGDLIVADTEGHRVWRVDSNGAGAEPIAGSGAPGSAPDTVTDALEAALLEPSGLAVDPNGRVFFSEIGGHRVRRLDPDGQLVTVAGDGQPGFSGDGGRAERARLRRPAGLSLAAGVLYVADSGNHRVRAVELEAGIIRTVAGSGVPDFAGDGGLAVEASLERPQSVTVSDDGSVLFIADTNNHRIRLINLDTGMITTFAGNGDEAFNGDLRDAGLTALSSPSGLALSPLGFLFVSDTGHHIVRRAAVRFISSRM